MLSCKVNRNVPTEHETEPRIMWYQASNRESIQATQSTFFAGGTMQAQDGTYYVYVLKLQGGKYYVGQTTNVQQRLKQHQEMRGSAWTRKYRVQGLADWKPKTSPFDEDTKVKELMMAYGVDNVRGGSYSQVDLPEETKQVLLREIMSAGDRCYRCGRSGHLLNMCPDQPQQQQRAPPRARRQQRRTFSCCRGVTRAGAPCRITVYLDSNGYCCNHRHQPVHDDGLNEMIEDDDSMGYASSSSEENVVVGEHRERIVSYHHNDMFVGDDSYPGGGYYQNAGPPGGCFRCGRTTHWADSCYATTHVDGYYLE